MRNKGRLRCRFVNFSSIQLLNLYVHRDIIGCVFSFCLQSINNCIQYKIINDIYSPQWTI